MLSSQVRVGVLRDRHSAKKSHPLKKKSLVVSRLFSQNAEIRSRTLDVLENLLRSNDTTIADISSPPDDFVLALLHNVQPAETPIQHECKARLLLAYFTTDNQVFSQLSQETVHAVVQSCSTRIERSKIPKDPDDNMILPVVFMLISHFQFQSNF